MEQHLFILLLFTGFVPLLLSVPRQYYLIQQGKNWRDARAYCRAKYTDLAIIRHNEDLIQLQNEAQTQQFSSSAWIGLYKDFDIWRWSMGNELSVGLRPWASGQPSDGLQNCGSIYPGGWADLHCSDLAPFVCFDDRYTGNQRYIFKSNRVTWTEAKTFCRQHHRDLASSRDANENSVIMGFISLYTWIGLFRDPVWKWADQTNFSTLSWMTGKPDNALGNENCGYINNSQVADARCSDIMPFFCYAVNITGQQQILGVKIRSSEDVNDPAVMAAILAQMEKKLKEKGMTGNFTMKWRKQPDGAVFHKVEEEKNTTVGNRSSIFQAAISFNHSITGPSLLSPLGLELVRFLVKLCSPTVPANPLLKSTIHHTQVTLPPKPLARWSSLQTPDSPIPSRSSPNLLSHAYIAGLPPCSDPDSDDVYSDVDFRPTSPRSPDSLY